ncbi:2-oxo-4-hydroxy-4-carboxy-5-ureidoimidazoline decarboxylase [Longimicrobium terrae]|uniref:2-oxo-4-hydroxy-4-carboxy-5-ureidoimidazoline decarboxylase n=1 Tax=Longimicrobium terrae TaxID=1639882 RepID=A0A841H2N8_9BACT|nr:OHCU decarboxylase [Longimicrobium terrae]MBB6072254.1 OHCU decarboxylase [Longimicrobium terrae]NNC28325.1 2-oxo-4-hydroxy-4-carboxy-5-ureidoimidazoline decarboxylase [Longimicrobium terrae]
MSGLARLNALPAEDAARELLTCCGSRAWARSMVDARPFADADSLLRRADEAWWALDEEDWREAFRSHPKIGERKAQAGQTDREQAWSSGEQAGMMTAAEATQAALAEGNRTYEARFGFIYIVCATGKSADEMLEILTGRLGNAPDAEIRVAAEEQRKITRIRLEKLLAT